MAQVDRIYGLVGTLGVKAPCRVASTANLTLSGLQTVDGVALAAEDRVLVKDQTNTVENGIYVVTTTAWQRAPDFDGARDVVKGTNVWVQEGTSYTNTLWYVTSVGTIGTNALTFAERGFTSATDAHSATSKATPVDADELPLLDSAASFSLKKLTWANLKATLLSAFDIAATTHAAASKAIPVDADEFSLVDSAESNILKKLTWGNLKATLKAYFDTIYATATSITSKLQSLSATVSANALTVTYNGGTLDFRSGSLATGTPTTISVGSNSITVPSGATLGTINATAARLVVLEAYNGGAPVLCIVNLAGGVQLDETNLISPTTISGTSNSNNVIYSASAVAANSPYRVVGFIDITEAIAGTWATSPTQTQGVGGQALAALSGIGYGQTWQNLTASRTLGTTYYNTTGKPITVSLTAVNSSGVSQGATVTVSGLAVMTSGNANGGTPMGAIATVPPGASYTANTAGNSVTWFELR